MLFCKNCEMFKLMNNYPNGICSLLTNEIITNANDNCRFLRLRKLTCYDCENRNNGCESAIEEICGGFQNRNIMMLGDILLDMYMRGDDVKSIVDEIINTMETSHYVKFIKQHKDDINFY